MHYHSEYLHYYIDMDIHDSAFKFKVYHDYLKELDRNEDNLDCCSRIQNIQLNMAQSNLKFDDLR